MALLNRTGWQLVAGAGVIALVGCGSGGGGKNSPASSVPSAPAISQQPLDQTVPAGQTATFSVGASGNGTLTYQWRKDGAPISGATSASFATAALTAADAGVYSCLVTNSLGGSSVGTATSPASLVVNTPPVIVTQPVSSPAISQSGSVSFTVVATGNGTLGYQWQKDGVNITLAKNATAQSATLTLTNLKSTDAGTYTCLVTAILNGTTTSITSAPAVLGVGQLPTINTQPAAMQTVVQGGPVSFTVDASATGGGTLSYQWRKDGIDIPAASNATATTATLTLAAVQGSDAGSYTCAVANTVNGNAGILATASAVLAVNVPPAISPISAQTGGQGGSVTFSVTATGNGSLSYQWYKGSVAPGNLLAGATSASLVLANLQAAAADAYLCVVTNTLNGTATTSTATTTLGVNQGPSVTAISDQTQPEGGSASFTVVGTGAGAVTYQWQRNGVNLDTTANPSAATGTLNLAAVAPTDDGAIFRCLVTDTVNGVAATTTGNAATLTVNKKPVFSTQVANQGFSGAGTATFTAAATSNGTVTYQWFKVASPDVAVGTGATLALTGLLAGDDGTQYYCIATSTLNSTTATATSAAGQLVLNGGPTISGILGTTAVENGPADLTITATGSGTLSYQWYKTSVSPANLVAGATGATYHIASTAKTQAGNYLCVVTNTVGGAAVSATSATAALAVNFAPVLDPNSGTPTPVAKETTNADLAVVYITTMPVGATMSYVWYKAPAAAGPYTLLTAGLQPSGSSLAFTSNNGLGKITFTGIKLADVGYYKCDAISNLGGTTATTTLSGIQVKMVLAQPATSNPVAATTIDKGGSATFTVTVNTIPAGAGTPSYQWLKDGNAIYGATGLSLTVSNAQLADAGGYTFRYTNADTVFGSNQKITVNSVAAALTVNPVVVPPVVTIDPFITAGQTGLLAFTQDQGPAGVAVDYTWTLTDQALTPIPFTGQSTRVITYTAPANGSVKASVLVHPRLGSSTDQASAVATATVKTVAFIAPDLMVPPVVHPSDNWMKAFTTAYPTETYTWSSTFVSGAPAPSISGLPSGVSPFSITSFSVGANPGVMTLNVNGQLPSTENATTSATVTIQKGVWVTKDGSLPTGVGAFPTATTLPNGRVLITGGMGYEGSTSKATTSAAYLYDPTSGRAVPTGSMSTSRVKHTATLLSNGSVLVVGGVAYDNGPTGGTGGITTPTILGSAEIWDPITGAWSLVAPMTVAPARFYHAAVRLSNGKVAVIGGATTGNVGGPSGPSNSIQIFDPASQSWATGPNLQIGRYAHTVTALVNDPVNGRNFADAGKLLVVGGVSTVTSSGTPSANDATWQPEILDLTAGTPRTDKTLTMTATRRKDHTATLLKDGNVFIAGSSNNATPTGQANVSALTAEIFSPSTGTNYQGTFTLMPGTLLGGRLGTSATGRAYHTANLLPDGTVLLAGGQGLGGASHISTPWSVELFTPGSSSPATGYQGGIFSYAPTAPATAGLGSTLHEAHNQLAAAQVASGQVVLIGGTGSGAASGSNQIEVFTPASGGNAPSITTPAGLDSGRMHHNSVLLAKGQVMVIGGEGTLGGVNASGYYNAGYLDTVRIYDAATNTWLATGNLNIARKDAAAVLLPNGTVLVTGGKTTLNPKGDPSAEIWNPAANDGAGTWTLLPNYLNTARSLHSMVVLADGRVLVMGGYNAGGGVKATEIFSGDTFTALAGGDLSEGKAYLSPVLLPPTSAYPGQVVVAGGRLLDVSGNGLATKRVEILDPTAPTPTWRRLTDLQVERSQHTTNLLSAGSNPGNQLVLIGGMTVDGSNSGAMAGVDPVTQLPVAGNATELYDVTLSGGAGGSVQRAPGVYSTALFTGDGHRLHQSLLWTAGTNSGKILVIAGPGASASIGTSYPIHPLSGRVCEIYDPTADTFTATTPLPAMRRLGPQNGIEPAEFTANLLSTALSATIQTDVLVVGGSNSPASTSIYRP